MHIHGFYTQSFFARKENSSNCSNSIEHECDLVRRICLMKIMYDDLMQIHTIGLNARNIL